MATIMTILIGVISLLGKQNKLTREVFWWLVAGREHLMFFSAKKALNERCELVTTVILVLECIQLKLVPELQKREKSQSQLYSCLYVFFHIIGLVRKIHRTYYVPEIVAIYC
jgi:hypothetical protein